MLTDDTYVHISMFLYLRLAVGNSGCGISARVQSYKVIQFFEKIVFI